MSYYLLFLLGFCLGFALAALLAGPKARSVKACFDGESELSHSNKRLDNDDLLYHLDD